MKPIIAILLLSMFSIALVNSRSPEKAKVMKLMDDINRERRHVSPGSANMREVMWSDCLSSVAANYLQQCNAVGSSNEERNTQAAAAGCESFGMTLGETIFHAPTVGNYDPVSIWVMQSRYYNFYENQCSEAGMCDDYLQVANAAVSSVGCAHIYESTLGEDGRTGETYVCYYAPAADNGRPYKQGESCNECGDLHGCNNGLCVEGEVTKPTYHTTHTHRSRHTRPSWIPTFPHIVTLPPQPSFPEGNNKNIDSDKQPEIPQGPKNDQEGPQSHGPAGYDGPKHGDGPAGHDGPKHGHGHGPAGNHGLKHDGPAGHHDPKHGHGPAGHDGPKHGHGHGHGPAGNHGLKHGPGHEHGHQNGGNVHGHVNGDNTHGVQGGAHGHGPMHGGDTHGPQNGAHGHGPMHGDDTHGPQNGAHGQGPMHGDNTHGPQNGAHGHGPLDGGNTHGSQNGGHGHGPMHGDNTHGPKNGAHGHGPMHGGDTHGPQNGAHGHGPLDGSNTHGSQNGGHGHGPMHGDNTHRPQNGAHGHGPMHGDNTYGPQNGAHGQGPLDGGNTHGSQNGVYGPINGPNGGYGYPYGGYGGFPHGGHGGFPNGGYNGFPNGPYGPGYYQPGFPRGYYIDGTDGHDNWNRVTPNHPKPTPDHENDEQKSTPSHIGNSMM